MEENKVRLNRYLSMCGAASRRKADEMISRGQVRVNGKIVDQLGTAVDIYNDVVTVSGKTLRLPQRSSYYIFNKPTGYLCSKSDPEGRKTIYELLPQNMQKLKYVGRLDMDTEGLLLLTDDGDMIEYLTHPRNQVPRTYHALVRWLLRDVDVEPLRKGVEYQGETYDPAQVRILSIDRHKNNTLLEITIREGKKREVRMMIRSLNLHIDRLKRISFGPLRLDTIPVGQYRPCKPGELEKLRKISNIKAPL
jgi:23S rRNA pseudouridine2605 synthase